MTQKMNPEWKTKWLEALRSGKYRQGKGHLRRRDDTYCCLGVLTDLCVKEGAVDLDWALGGPALPFYTLGAAGSVSSLPAVIAELTNVGSLGERGDVSIEPLYRLNDSLGYNFEEIANVIEEEF